MRKLTPLFRCTAALPCIFFLSAPSCVQSRLTARLSEHESAQKSSYGDFKASTFSTNASPMGWDQAVKRTLESNLAYQNQRFSYEQTQKQRKKLWLGLVPRFFTFVNINSSIDEIADISSDDLTFNLAANINIPNPITFYSQLYAIALQELQSQYQLELQRRQLISRVYAAFIQHKDLAEAEKELAIMEKNLEKQDPSNFANSLRALDERKALLQLRRENLRLTTNTLLNTPGQHWKFVGKAPDISYANRINKLNFGKGYGSLGLKLQTLQIESILISKLDAEQARLPSLSLGLSTPQLYSSSSEDNFQFNSEDYELFTGLSKSIDITDVFGKERIQNANFRARISREQLRLSMESEISRLEATKKTYNRLLLQRKIAQEQLSKVQNSSSGSSVAQLNLDLQRLNAANEALETLNRQLKQLDLQLWIWDDTHWQ